MVYNGKTAFFGVDHYKNQGANTDNIYPTRYGTLNLRQAEGRNLGALDPLSVFETGAMKCKVTRVGSRYSCAGDTHRGAFTGVTGPSPPALTGPFQGKLVRFASF